MNGNYKRKLRSFLGILLILLSLAGLLFWEMKGRELVMTDTVLVAKQEIPEGTAVERSMFMMKGVSKSSLIKNAMGPADLKSLQGKMSTQFIAQNGQIIPEYFQRNDLYLKENESIFVIKPEWIAMRSSSLRRGDMVDFYGSDGIGFLGNYRIAYVKDKEEREVVEAAESSGRKTSGGILERMNSTSYIDHIEIITTISEYERLEASLEGSLGTTPAALIIVQHNQQPIMTGKEPG